MFHIHVQMIKEAFPDYKIGGASSVIYLYELDAGPHDRSVSSVTIHLSQARSFLPGPNNGTFFDHCNPEYPDNLVKAIKDQGPSPCGNVSYDYVNPL